MNRISPQIMAQNLLSMSADRMDLNELNVHLVEAKLAFVSLFALRSSTSLSGFARLQINFLMKRVTARLDVILWLIEERSKVAFLEANSGEDTSSAKVPSRKGAKP